MRAPSVEQVVGGRAQPPDVDVGGPAPTHEVLTGVRPGRRTMSNQKSVLTATNLSAGYGGTPVIRDVSLTLTGGGTPIGVIGQSGVGKTTLIHALVGVLKPSGGRVTFNDRTVSKLALGAKKNFGVSVRRVQQNGFTGLDSRLTVRKALEADLSKARKAGRDTGASVEDALSTVLLENRYESRTIGTLSGGEKQRLALASALATRPDILILDEPTTALDHTLRLEARPAHLRDRRRAQDRSAARLARPRDDRPDLLDRARALGRDLRRVGHARAAVQQPAPPGHPGDRHRDAQGLGDARRGSASRADTLGR